MSKYFSIFNVCKVDLVWCANKGEAKKVYQKKLKRTQHQKLGSPAKKILNVKKSAESVTLLRER